MTIYCQGAKKAIVAIITPIQERVVSLIPPITVEISTTGNSDYVDYTHDMSNPINQEFNRPISGVELNDSVNDWVFSGQYPASDPRVHSRCPTLTESHLFDTLHINKTKLVSNFDSYYPDNVGTCTYRVYFGVSTLTITDSTGLIYSHNFTSNPVYQVSCDDNCPPGCCKIDCPEYPGYCCISESLINSLITRLKNG